MKYTKSTLTIVTLCAALTTNAKQIGKKTTPTTQPAPITYVQPTPKSYVQPQPAPKPQPQTKTPTQTTQPQSEKLSPNIINAAKEIFAKYPTELDKKTQEECTKAAQENKPIFDEIEERILFLTMNDIVKDFLDKFPNIEESAISDAIINYHPKFQTFKTNLTPDQYNIISHSIRHMILISTNYQLIKINYNLKKSIEL